MIPRPDRRQFLLGATTLAATSALNAQPARQLPSLRTRRSVTDPAAAADLADYEKAVKAMNTLQATDRRHWVKQAEIHETSCPHQNWFFLPWHRAYLDYFEQICASLCGNPTFALPYWDWSKDPSIPAPFWVAGSSLLHAREATAASKVRDDVVGPTAIARVQGVRNFEDYGSPAATRLRQVVANGALENPHNYIHRFVGKDMATNLSPLDPIFWLHHANIDRLWAEWQRANPGGTPTSARWLNVRMPFPNPKVGGAEPDTVVTTPQAVVTTEGLGYTYDTTPQRVFAAAPRPSLFVPVAPLNLQVVGSAGATKALAGAEGSVTATLSKLPDELKKRLGRLAFEGDEDLSARLIIEDMEVDPKTTFGVRVFLNCPDLKAAKTDDPHYVGDVYFFGLDHAGGGHGANAMTVRTSAVLSLSATLKALAAKGGYEKDKPLSVQCVPIGVSDQVKAAGRVTFGEFRVELSMKE